jgi:hypothetical protein
MPRVGASGIGGASNGGSGSGNVTGVPPTTVDAIVRWNNTSGTSIKNSPGTLVQDSGAIEAQAFVFNRQILEDVTVPDHYSVVSSDVELVSGDIILDGDATLILV